MKHLRFESVRNAFGRLLESPSVQAMKMTLPPGGTSDDSVSNEHPRAEQWMFVVQGTGQVVVGRGTKRRRVSLTKHSLLLIEKGELHQIRNTGRTRLATINFYVPPAYGRDGEPRPSIQR